MVRFVDILETPDCSVLVKLPPGRSLLLLIQFYMFSLYFRMCSSCSSIFGPVCHVRMLLFLTVNVDH